MIHDIEKIIESKKACRRKLADLPMGEKFRILDAMRERQVAIRASRPIDVLQAESVVPNDSDPTRHDV